MTDTTWGYRFWCPECGHEGVTQDTDLRDEMVYQHNRRVHGGRDVCEMDGGDGQDEAAAKRYDIPVEEFPADETPVVPGTSRDQQSDAVVIGGE